MNSGLLTTIIISLIVLAISITLHEFMHGYMARLLGDTTAKDSGRLSFNPIKHVDPFATVLLPIILILLNMPPFGAAKPVPVNFARLKYGEFGGALVGVIGPLTNLLLATFGAFIYKALGGGLLTGLSEQFFALFITINVGFFVFNMIPFPPLDGSRVLYAFSPEPLQRIMQSIESFGLIAIGLFIILIVPLIGPALTAVNNWILNAIV